MEKLENEIWKDVPYYEGLYQVSNFGNVKSLDRVVFNSGSKKNNFIKGKLLKKCISSVGYYLVVLSKKGKRKSFFVHYLVACAFLNHKPNIFNLVVNHKDFNKLNNVLGNLEIVSHRQNSNRMHIKSSSEFVGVSWRKTNKKWASYIVIMSKLYFLGLFENEKDASKCYFENLRNWEEKKILPKAKTYSSSHNGIYYKKERNKWGLSIMRNGKRKFYGYFNSEEEAYIRKIELKI